MVWLSYWYDGGYVSWVEKETMDEAYWHAARELISERFPGSEPSERLIRRCYKYMKLEKISMSAGAKIFAIVEVRDGDRPVIPIGDLDEDCHEVDDFIGSDSDSFDE